MNSDLDGMETVLHYKKNKYGVPSGGVILGSTTLIPSAVMKPMIIGPINGQAARLAFSQSEMSTLWSPELSEMSRGVVFYLGVLQMPRKSY